ncbi:MULTISPECIES: Hsp20/alpha crystallin family protein [Nocardiopsis]|jgi:HSP20 family protein|uniref:Hsp20 family protein n=2 Tax=Nocardiopsis alba TaxID=53437 RepID=A0A7K2IPP2_9ACTN|nr:MULTISPECIES: Hsp20/alpha crystallin family protein [Nocardiopsis]AFR06570.1 hsp20/alpha crystallin family protein [Nocardiopsis alba ATCC BAA-2165]MEC3894185.1 Hsp20/alpha crystallin family protein [Nocardiopsis sp. LDBS1602]MYR31797.1 Hsp20 family protein [Nocardiopsis alba]
MTPKKFGNPFYGVVDMITEMNRISDTMTSIENGQAGDRQRGFADAWSPPTDILARGNDLVIRCEVSGVLEEDVTVSLVHGVLTISGERRRDGDDVVYYSSERFMGTFRREISLPDGVTESDIEAGYGEGLLEVTVHGAANASAPRRIAIKRRKKPGK